MLDHVTIGVCDLERSKAFYDKALKAIGIERLYSEGAEFFGYGASAQLSSVLLRGICPRSGRPQHRGRLPPSCVIGQFATELGELHILQAFDPSVV